MPTSLGLVGITNKGTYNAQTTYVKGNFVYHNGSSWLLIANTATGVEPNENNSTTWQYLAKGFNVLPFTGATDQADGTGGTVPQPLAGEQDKVLFGNATWDGVIDYYEYANRQDHVISNASGIPDTTIHKGELLYIAVESEYHDIGAYILMDNDVTPPYSVNQSNLKRLSNSKNSIFGLKSFGSAGNAIVAGLVPPIQYSEKDSGKVLQPTGWGKKLQLDVVKQGNEYGYINSNNVFIPFKSQADIDAAVSAARVGNATAADVRKGKTFTNSSNSGLVGTLVTERFQVGKLSTRRNIDRWGDTWSAKTWNGLTNFYGQYVWTDGDNIYYSGGTAQQYVLNKSTSTWSTKTWSGFTDIWSNNIWTDGDNIYYSSGSTQKVLNKSTSTWSDKTWSGITDLTWFSKGSIWTDGDNIYSSYNDLTAYVHLVLNKSTSTWSAKTWNGFTNFVGGDIWTDGDNIYLSTDFDNYVLNKSTSTWSAKTWNGLTEFLGSSVWTDGNNIYYSRGSSRYQYVLNKSTSTWSAKTWNGFTNFVGGDIWTDGDNIYFSNKTTQYVLNKVKTHWVV